MFRLLFTFVNKIPVTLNTIPDTRNSVYISTTCMYLDVLQYMSKLFSLSAKLLPQKSRFLHSYFSSMQYKEKISHCVCVTV